MRASNGVTDGAAVFPLLTGLYRLLAWLSPNFPIGGFSYSHGLEAAVESGAVHDRVSLGAWVAAIVKHGSGRVDADIVCCAYRAAAGGDLAALSCAIDRGTAYRASAELALESAQQGTAFTATHRAAWPNALFASGVMTEKSRQCYSAAFGVATARGGIALEDALVGYLQAFAGNLIAAGMRLGLIGQTDGQSLVSALEPVVVRAARGAMTRDPEDFGTATFAADLASIAHETQYSRLFRS
jgi:urease accessory protein